MPIHYIPNDPLAIGAIPMRTINPRPDRPAGRAGFTYGNPQKEGLHAPGTESFLYWQCREAALAAVELWEDLHGSFGSWQIGKKIGLIQDAGDDLNAYYDRFSLSFFHSAIGKQTYYSGASTDVVAHEAGHGFLDAIRPDFWDSNLLEVNSFHEAFGDCIAILAALMDRDTRIALVPTLEQSNGVEATAEELSAAIRARAPNSNAGAPRRALNNFKWVLPSTLPLNGGAGVLINEVHSFGQVFSGCFYDLIVNIFKASGGATADNLLAAARTAGAILFKATAQAPQRERFFREVGRTMMLIDQQLNEGDNQDSIRTAFQGHDIPLGSSIMLTPESTLEGLLPKIQDKMTLAADLRRDLLKRLSAATGARMRVSPIKIAGEKLAQAVYQRLVPLDRVSKRLKDVVAAAPETVVMGNVHGMAAVIGTLPNAGSTSTEVEAFVQSLMEHGQIALEPQPNKKSIVHGMTTTAVRLPSTVTHTIREIRGQKTLVRLRFSCTNAACRFC